MEAYRYLQSRGITDEIIERYKIGYTVSVETLLTELLYLHSTRKEY
jgi:DNA primase